MHVEDYCMVVFGPELVITGRLPYRHWSKEKNGCHIVLIKGASTCTVKIITQVALKCNCMYNMRTKVKITHSSQLQ